MIYNAICYRVQSRKALVREVCFLLSVEKKSRVEKCSPFPNNKTAVVSVQPLHNTGRQIGCEHPSLGKPVTGDEGELNKPERPAFCPVYACACMHLH